MDWKKGLALGCGGCLLLCLVVAGAVVAFMFYVAEDPKGVDVVATTPVDVTVGEPFELEVRITNLRQGKPFGLTDIDLDEGYLSAFTVLSTTPNYVSTMHVPLDNTRSFTFDRPVAAGETAVFSFELRAEQVGSFRGDVDVCEGSRFLTKMVQTSVREAGAGTDAPKDGQVEAVP
jgi:hypothetical protein